MTIGLDFDGVINDAPHFEPIVRMIGESDADLFLLTSRDEIDDFVREKVIEIVGRGIPMMAMGKFLCKPYKSKAEYMIDTRRIPDLFFDDDIFEVRECYNLSIPAILVPPIRTTDAPMNFIFSKLIETEFFRGCWE